MENIRKVFTKKSLDELNKKIIIGDILTQTFDCSGTLLSTFDSKRRLIYFGTCPFCGKESFYAVSDFKQYTCFNCHVHGDVIDLLIKRKKWSYNETVDYLAKRFDVELIIKE